MFKKGNAVMVKATVSTEYRDHQERNLNYLRLTRKELVHVPSVGQEPLKCLIKQRLLFPQKGMVVGYTLRATGHRVGGYEIDDPPSLCEDKRHKVIVVESLQSQRWAPPWTCLEEDLILAEEIE